MRAFLILCVSLVLIACIDVLVFRRVVALQSTTQSQFDAIIVLGCPSLPDGRPSPEQQSRVLEAVREYQRGVAKHIIFTGGAAHNAYIEAVVMAHDAQSEGIPASAIFVESRAFDTLQNAEDSVRIMQAHGWQSAEIISSPDHIYRAAYIFNRTPIAWRMHAASLPTTDSLSTKTFHNIMEGVKTIRLQVLMAVSHPFRQIERLRS